MIISFEISYRLHKIRPILDMTRRAFQKQMNPPREQAVDEGMIKYKGRYFARQYMPNKPVKRGLKVYINWKHFATGIALYP